MLQQRGGFPGYTHGNAFDEFLVKRESTHDYIWMGALFKDIMEC